MPNLDLASEAVLLQVEDVRQLLEPVQGPCISIYLPTTRFPPCADENRILFKGQLRAVQQELGLLERQHAQHSKLLEPLLRLEDDVGFWGAQRDGFAAFRSPERFYMYRLLRRVPKVAAVADSFHIKPLIRLVQEAGRFQVLCVSNERVALYEGSRRSPLDEVPLHPQVPRDMGEAIGWPARVTKPRRTRYDQGESDPRDQQLLRYFRRLDDAIWTYHSERSRLPLILAALPEYQGLFRQASRNLMLIEPGIPRDPFNDIDKRQLRQLAWEALRPTYEERLRELREHYDNARAYGQATDALDVLAQWACHGRLETLLVQEDRYIGGSIDHRTGKITYKDLQDPAVDDVIDDLAELMMRQGGQVVAFPADQMPTDTGAAGIRRY